MTPRDKEARDKFDEVYRPTVQNVPERASVWPWVFFILATVVVAVTGTLLAAADAGLLRSGVGL